MNTSDKQQWRSLISLIPFFIALFCTALGNGAEYVASSWYAIKTPHAVTNQLFQLMFYMFCFWFPTMTVGPIMGSLVDRFKRQHCFLGAAIAGFFLTGGFAFLFHYSNSPLLWPLLLVGMGLLFSMRFPATYALNQELANSDNLLLVTAVSGIMFELGNLTGNALGGWLTAWISLPFLMSIVCACFVLAVITALMLPKTDDNPERQQQKKQPLSRLYMECFACLTHLKKHPRTGVLAIIQMLSITCFMTNPVVLVPFIKNTLHLSASFFGLIETLISIGFVAASFMLKRLRKRFGAENTLIALMLLMFLAFVMISADPSKSMAIISFSMVGFAFASWSLSSTLLFECTPQNIQGRLQALISSVTGFALIIVDGCALLIAHHTSSHVALFSVMLGLIAISLGLLVWVKKHPAEA